MRERKLNRLDVWNYDSSGFYYITINTMHYIDFFGHIQKDNMELSEIGRIAHKCWIALPDHFNYISLDEFIIMPNHFHGIIKILPSNEYEPESHGFKISSNGFDIQSERFQPHEFNLPSEGFKSESRGFKSHEFNMPSEGIKSKRIKVYGTGMPVPYDKTNVHDKTIDPIDKNNAQYKKLPIIIGSYKSAVSKLAHKKGYENFGWHKSYYDHIVHNKDDMNRIRKYISNNPSNWNGNEYG